MDRIYGKPTANPQNGKASVKPFKYGELLFALDRFTTLQVVGRLLKARHSSNGPIYKPVAKSLLYVAASSLPYHITGYTTRTQAVIRAMVNAGAQVHPVTRPGYPWDRSDRLLHSASAETVVSDVVYRHSMKPTRDQHIIAFAINGAKIIADIAISKRVAVIHAASNHRNALPALLAAQKLGIPFHYEMRGLWELSRSTRQSSFKHSARYCRGLALEGLVASHADQVFCISEALGVYAKTQWGIAAEKIALLPNCVDPESVLPADPEQVDPMTIGYAGSLSAYEGLDTLLEAIGQLARRGSEIKLRIVGDGEARPDLEAQVRRLQLDKNVQFLGRIEPAEAKALIARCALVCIPRKPFDVCAIVPPIKLVEALALGKPVIVPDLPVFRDELGPHPPGFFFQSGNAEDLARVIHDAMADPDALIKLGKHAREYAVTYRAWQPYIASIVKLI